MRLFRPLMAAGFTAVLAGSALAQTAALVEIDDSFVVQPWNMSVDAIDDMTVLGAGGTKVGEVEEVLGTDASTPTALVVDFDDNSTYGDDDRVIPLDQFTPGANGLTANFNPANVRDYPAYDD